MAQVIERGRILTPRKVQERVDIFNPAQFDKIGRALSADDKQAKATLKARALFNAAANSYTDKMIALAAAHHHTTLSTEGSFPVDPGTAIEITYQGAEAPIDMSWVPLFDFLDFRNTQEETFRMIDIEDGITFRSYENGERVELYGVKGAQVFIPFQRFGSGFQWEQEWLDDNKFFRVTDGVASAQHKYARDMAANAYQIVTDPTGLDTVSRDTTGNSIIARDVRTVNNAMTAILQDLYDEDDVEIANPRFFLLYNSLTPGYAERVAAILTAQLGIANPTLGVTQLAHPVTPLGSPRIPTGQFYLVLPGRKLKHAVRMDLTMYANFNPYTYSGDRIFWGRYNTVRGDNRQVRIVPTVDAGGDGDGDD